MGKLLERLSDIARRAGDLTPLREPIRRILWEGNRDRALAGTDAEGRAFAPLAASTLKHRDGSGPPQAPHGAGSRVVTDYVVDVQAGPGRLSFTGSWPGLAWMIYHIRGTRRMPRRDPLGFTRSTLDRARTLLREHVMKK